MSNSNLSYQESLSKMTMPELTDAVSELTADYRSRLDMLMDEVLVRTMEKEVDHHG